MGAPSLLLVLTGVLLRMAAVCMLPVLLTVPLLPNGATALVLLLPDEATARVLLLPVLATWVLEGRGGAVGDAISCMALMRRLMPWICSLSS